MSIYADPRFDSFQMQQIEYGLEVGIDVSIYADPKFDSWQMSAIRGGLEDGLDVSIYAKPELSSEQMTEIRLNLLDERQENSFLDHIDAVVEETKREQQNSAVNRTKPVITQGDEH